MTICVLLGLTENTGRENAGHVISFLRRPFATKCIKVIKICMSLSKYY